MKRLKSNLNCLAGQVPVLTEDERRSTVGGLTGTGLSGAEILFLFHYMDNTGTTMYLPSSMLSDIGQEAARCGVVTGSTWVQINGQMYQKRTVNLYASGQYECALGTCTLYYDQCGQVAGLKDTYDFNSDKNRDFYHQVGTSLGSLIPGSGYAVRSGVYD